jgi:hypothetical protein
MKRRPLVFSYGIDGLRVVVVGQQDLKTLVSIVCGSGNVNRALKIEQN